MNAYAGLPIAFLKFWFLEAPKGIIEFYGSLNKAFFQLFSLPILVRTFFKPIKNEYREGLVAFSIGMGIAVKSVIIFVNLFLFIGLILAEVLALFIFITLPLTTFLLLFL